MFDMCNKLRRKLFPASKEDISWRHDELRARLETLQSSIEQVHEIVSPYSAAPPVENKGRKFYASHHPEFRNLSPFRMMVPKGFKATFAGSLIRNEFWWEGDGSPDREVEIDLPVLNEEYWEWIDLIQSVRDAGDRLVIVELGAGYGRWSVAAKCLAKRLRPNIDVHAIAVEAEPAHFAMLKQHFVDNGFDPTNEQLLEAAVNAAGGEVSFVIGNPQEWYGQAIVPDGYNSTQYSDVQTVRVKAMTLDEVLSGETRVDLIDMDIQGAEGEVIASSAAVLNAKVRRVHVGTHSSEVEEQICESLSANGWICVAAFPCQSKSETDFGVIDFGDGVQSWINPRLS